MTLLFWLACTPKGDEVPTPPADFPAGFHFGAATAGFQVDMGCTDRPDCTDPNSDWYQWVTDPGILAEGGLHVSGDPLTDGPGMWGSRFEDDVALMQASGFTAYRMSLEWSRLFPDAAAEAAMSVSDLAPHANADAGARYHEQFAALKAAGIEPVVTIKHYTLPLWVHDGVACHDDVTTCGANGWLDEARITRLLSLYAGFAAREFGGEVDTWFTLNEPYATGLSGYLLPGEDRSAPPGISFDFERTVTVMQNQLIAHAAMVDQVRAEDTVDATGDGMAEQVGIVLNMAVFVPEDPDDDKDVLGVVHADYLYHQLFYDALALGQWDSDLDGTPDEDRPELGGRLDVIGVNYYNRVIVKGAGVSLSAALPLLDFSPEFSWEPYPEGLGIVVNRAAEWGLPVWVTENGTPEVEGERGVEILDGHLASLAEAMDGGADVRSYLYWSFVDNYEWNHGYGLKFGLHSYTPGSLERQERPVGARLAAIATSRRLDP